VTQYLKAFEANAEGVGKLQPRVARASALPWEKVEPKTATLKGLPNGLRSFDFDLK